MTKILLFLTLISNLAIAQIEINKPFLNFSLQDQFDKPHKITKDTQKIIFAFSKDIGHSVNDFLEKQDKNYLLDKKAQFVIDLSSAPSLIRSFFIVPKLEKYSYPVLIFTDEDLAKKYKDEKNTDKIMLVSLDNLLVTNISFYKNTNELKEALKK